MLVKYVAVFTLILKGIVMQLIQVHLTIQEHLTLQSAILFTIVVVWISIAQYYRKGQL